MGDKKKRVKKKEIRPDTNRIMNTAGYRRCDLQLKSEMNPSIATKRPATMTISKM
jgi:hypothetical protein